MISVASLLHRAKQHIGSLFQTELCSDGDLIAFLNEAIIELCNKSKPWQGIKYEQSITTVTNQEIYPVSYILQVFYVKVGDEHKQYCSYLDYQSLTEDEKSNYVAINGESIITKMTGTIDITYSGYPPIVHVPTDTVELPSKFFDVLLYGILYRIKRLSRDFQESQIIQKEMDNKIQELARQEQNNTPYKPIIIGIDNGLMLR